MEVIRSIFWSRITNRSAGPAGLLLLLWIWVGTARAQLPDYHLQLFDYSSGIRPGTIRSVIRDNKGFLWILHFRSVQRFDGRKVINFRVKGTFTHLFCDRSNRVWISGTDRVYFYDEHLRDFTEVTPPAKDSAGMLGDLFQLPDQEVSLQTSSGFLEFQPDTRRFVPSIRITPPLPRPFSARVFAACRHTLFFRNRAWIYRYDTREGRLDSLPDRNLQAIFALNADSLLAATWNNNSFWYDFKTRTIATASPPRSEKGPYSPSFSVRGLTEFEPGKFFVPAREGIFEYDNSTHAFRRLKFFLDGRAITTNDYANSIFTDPEGIVWMATIDGVARFASRQSPIGLIRIRQLNDGLSTGIDNIRKMVEDEHGNLWLATGAGFVCWKKDKDDWLFFLPSHNQEDRLSHPSIRGLVYDGRYLILGPTDLGVWLFDPRTYQYKRPSFDSPVTRKLSLGDFIDDIVTLRSGDHLIMGRDALYLLDGKTYALKLVENPASRENTNSAYQGADGIIWLTTMTGLHCLDANLNYLLKAPLGPEFHPIICGFVLPDNRLLFSSPKGVFTARYRDGNVTVEKFTDVFDDSFLITLYVEDNGIVWATSDDGIYRLDPATSELNLFDNSDNVQGYGFNGNNWMRTREGVLFFGGLNGMNYLRPEKLDLRNEALKVYIEEVRSGNNDAVRYPVDRQAVLDFARRGLEISFVAPYFNNAEKVRYRYRLSGLDDEWKYTDNNNLIRFSSLPPGDYRLQVEAGINNVDWAAADRDFSFRIKRPFWMTWWFVTAAICLIAGGLGLFIRNRNRKIEEQQEALEAEQAINYFTSSMDGEQSVDEVLWGVARDCIGRLNFEDCVIYLMDDERNLLVQKAAFGPKSAGEFEIEEPLSIPVGKGIVGSAAATGRPEVIADTSKDPRYILDDKRRLSEISVPILSDGRVLGVIDCEHSKKAFFTQKHLSILTTIASLCAGKMVKATAEAEKRKAEKILMDTRQKMADVEMQALRAQMNPHFIFNCLNSINRYIVKSDQATASLYLTRFAKLIRLILDNSNSKAVTLSNEMEALRLYIEMESIRFEKQFTYSIEVDESVLADNVFVPPLIIQPYVENAIWHGLLHKESAGHLTIRLFLQTEDLLICEIQDDGVGREKARELRSKSAATKKSLGMQLTEDRLALLNKQAQMEASVAVEDLKTSDGRPAGTRVILKIPIDS